MINKDQIRNNFSIYKNYKHERGLPLVYLDSASTSLTPDSVVEAMSEYYTHYRSNTERSSFSLSLRAEAEVDLAREKVAKFIDAESKENIIFTSGATDAANKIVDMLIDNPQQGLTFLTSVVEHHSVYVTLEQKAKKSGVRLLYTEIKEDGSLDYDALERNVVDEKVNVIFTQLASNVTGQVNDLARIKQIANRVGSLVVCDASQAIGHMPVSVETLGVDALFFSAHKMCGPTGVGVLYVKKELLQKLIPTTYGGGSVQKVSKETITFQEGTKKFEPGTANISGIIGLGSAISFIEKLGLDQTFLFIDNLLDYTVKELQKINNISIYSAKENIGIVSFSIGDIHAHDVEYLLAEAGIATRAGYHCAENFTRHISKVPLTRISLHIYNTKEDIDTLVLEIINIIKKFGK